MEETLPINLALDTSFILNQNFLAGGKILSLTDLVKKGIVNIYITDIVYKEVIRNFSLRVTNTIERTNKPSQNIAKEAYLLKNFSDFNCYFNLPKIIPEDLENRFSIMFDNWIKELKVTIINTTETTIGKVFDQYFNNQPPFNRSDKKK